MATVGLGVVLGGSSVGCASRAVEPRDATKASNETPPLVLGEMRITDAEPADLERRFQVALDQLMRDEFIPAAKEFDSIAASDPDGKTAVLSLFNAGIAYHGMGELDKALDRFQKSAEKSPAHPSTKTAWLRISRIYGQLERWEELERVATNTLERADLTVLEQIEAMGAKGLGLVEMGKVEEAAKVIYKARDIIEEKHLGQSGKPPLELAQVSFALGEIRRLKGEKVVFDPFPEDFGAVLEDRCTQLLDAQYAYQDAMRSLDAHWSAMAGYRIGQLYSQLHKDVMAMKVPMKNQSADQRALFEAAVRLRYRTLLSKGLDAMTAVVAMGERTGESSPWISRARSAKKELEDAITLEKQANAKLPYTEEEIRLVMDEMRDKKNAKGAAPAAPKKKPR